MMPSIGRPRRDDGALAAISSAPAWFPGAVRHGFWLTLFVVVFTGCWWISYGLHLVPGLVSWFLPAGVRLIFLLASPPRYWWRWGLGETISVLFFIQLDYDYQYLISAIASATLGFWCYSIPVYVWVTRAGGVKSWDVSTVGRVFAAAFSGAAVAASAHMVTLLFDGKVQSADAIVLWASFLLGDGVGATIVLVCCGVVVMAAEDARTPLPWRSQRPSRVAIALGVVAAVALLEAQLAPPAAALAYYVKLLYLVPMAVAALLGGVFAVSVATLALITALLLGQVLGHPWGTMAEDQFYIIAVAFGGLSLGAARDSQSRLTTQLRQQNARLQQLVSQLNTMNTDYQHIAERLVTAEERERGRIARELHDGLGQVLSAARIRLAAARNLPLGSIDRETALDETGVILDNAYVTAREIMDQLSPSILRRRGLRGAIEGSELAAFLAVADIKLSIDFADDVPLLSDAAALNVLRIVQECANNTVRHANASTFAVRLVLEGDGLLLEVADDGVGFDAARPPSGMGLRNITDRVASLGGEHRLQSGAAGTVHWCRFPLRELIAEDDESSSKVAFLPLG